MRIVAVMLFAAALSCAVPAVEVSAGTPTRPAPSHAGTRCTASTVHPIGARVTALDPVSRGAIVRLLVSATSLVALDAVQVRLVMSGAAANRGPSRLMLGALAPGQRGEAIFTMAMPATGGRQYVQFEISGDGPNGRLTRGACFNLLPDGPAETGRLVVTPQGARRLEVAATRID